MHSQILLRNEHGPTEENKRFGQFLGKDLQDLLSILEHNSFDPWCRTNSAKNVI